MNWQPKMPERYHRLAGDCVPTGLPGLLRVAKWAARNAHWLITLLLAIALIPAFAAAKLPYHINWFDLLDLYWVSLAARSILVAAIFYVLTFPKQETLVPVWKHYRAQKPRLVVLAVFGWAMVWEHGWGSGLTLVVDAIALAELLDRGHENPGTLRRVLSNFLVPATYVFLVMVLVFCYNDVIVSLKLFPAYDAAFNKLDGALFGGLTVSHLVHAAVRQLPLPVFGFLEFVYYEMFAQIGAALIITAIYFGRKRALQFAGSLATAYYLALALFFFLPNLGPFAICPGHFSAFPHTLMTHGVQRTLLIKAWGLWLHKLSVPVDTDYYIGFPSMHIAQPLIVLWFLRKWKRIAIALIAYDVILMAAILLLEWHYFVDLLGGALVAVVAIAMVCPRDQTAESAASVVPAADVGAQLRLPKGEVTA